MFVQEYCIAVSLSIKPKVCNTYNSLKYLKGIGFREFHEFLSISQKFVTGKIIGKYQFAKFNSLKIAEITLLVSLGNTFLNAIRKNKAKGEFLSYLYNSCKIIEKGFSPKIEKNILKIVS